MFAANGFLSFPLRALDLLFLCLLSVTLVARSGLPAEVETAELEPLGSLPDVLSISPHVHHLGHRWQKFKLAQLDMLALLLELYPDHDLVFLDRDATYLKETALAQARIDKDPGLKSRILSLNVSRLNVADPLLLRYVEQQGVTLSKLRSGRKFLFVDSGFEGSLPRAIARLFPIEFREQFETRMIISASMGKRSTRNPSTRSFGVHLNRRLGKFDSERMLSGLMSIGADALVHSYARLPKGLPRATHFLQRGDRILPARRPVGADEEPDESDGIIGRAEFAQHLEDLLAFMETSAAQARLAQKRSLWRRARWLALHETKVAVLEFLASIQKPRPSFFPFSLFEDRSEERALVKDFVEWSNTHAPANAVRINRDEVGIPDEYHVSAWSLGDALAAHSADDAELFRSPGRKLSEELRQGRFSAFEKLFEAYAALPWAADPYEEGFQLLAQGLVEHLGTPQIREAALSFLARKGGSFRDAALERLKSHILVELQRRPSGVLLGSMSEVSEVTNCIGLVSALPRPSGIEPAISESAHRVEDGRMKK